MKRFLVLAVICSASAFAADYPWAILDLSLREGFRELIGQKLNGILAQPKIICAVASPI